MPKTLWWGASIATLVLILVLAGGYLTVQQPRFVWNTSHQLAHYLQESPEAMATVRAMQQRIEDAYTSGRITNLAQMHKQIDSHPLVQSDRIHQSLLHHVTIDLSLFVPIGRINNHVFFDRKGKLKDIPEKNSYTGGLNIQMPADQLQQFLPEILFLRESSAQHGLDLQIITIHPTGMLSVQFGHGWVMELGPQPDLQQIFDRFLTALPQVQQRGNPVRFDFRYHNAMAVTYNKSGN